MILASRISRSVSLTPSLFLLSKRSTHLLLFVVFSNVFLFRFSFFVLCLDSNSKRANVELQAEEARQALEHKSAKDDETKDD